MTGMGMVGSTRLDSINLTVPSVLTRYDGTFKLEKTWLSLVQYVRDELRPGHNVSWSHLLALR